MINFHDKDGKNDGYGHLKDGLFRPMNHRKALSHTKIHYLRAIQDLWATHGYVRNTDIAAAINRTRGSVTVALNRLNRQGLITFDQNKFVRLTPVGQSLVTEYTGAKAVIYDFLKNVLLLPEKQALEEACQLEDDLSRDTIHALLKLICFIKERNSTITHFMKDFKRYCADLVGRIDCRSCESCLINQIDTEHTYCVSGCFLRTIEL